MMRKLRQDKPWRPQICQSTSNLTAKRNGQYTL